MAKVPVSEELESFVDVLSCEMVGVTVEAVDVVLELGGELEAQQLDVAAAVPLGHDLVVVLLRAVVRQPEPDARRWN